MKRLIVSLFVAAALIIMVGGCSKDHPTQPPPPPPPPTSDFPAQQTIAENTVTDYQQFLQNSTPREARAQMVAQLIVTPNVQSAGISADSITVWWQSTSGVEYCLITETRASLTDTTQQSIMAFNPPSFTHPRTTFGLPHNTLALILSPYQWDWNLLGLLPLQDETHYINDILTSINYTTTYKVNASKSAQNVSMADFQHFSDYGVIAIASHGGVDHQGNVIISTGVMATEQLHQQYLQDLLDHNLVEVVYIDKWFSEDILAFAVTPGWMNKHYPQKLENTLIYTGVCKSMFNNTMSNALIGTGSTYFGWDQSVATGQATETGKDLFAQLAVNALNCEEAYAEVRDNGNTVYTPPPPPISYEPVAHFLYTGNQELYLREEPVRIAVSPEYWDDIGTLLASFGYNVSEIALSDLSNNAVTSQYDIIALNCAPSLYYWANAAASNLRDFVNTGGKLYCSDWAFAFVDASFPGYITYPASPYIGDPQTVQATVLDQNLAQYLGVTSVDITFDLGAWVTIESLGPTTNMLLSGDVITVASGGEFEPITRWTVPQSVNIFDDVKPLAASFSYGQGTVVYTSFHNEAQISEPSRHILEYFTILE